MAVASSSDTSREILSSSVSFSSFSFLIVNLPCAMAMLSSLFSAFFDGNLRCPSFYRRFEMKTFRYDVAMDALRVEMTVVLPPRKFLVDFLQRSERFENFSSVLTQDITV